MKRIVICLLSLLLVSCTSNRNDYYVFNFDDYSISVGYDNVKLLKSVFTIDETKDLNAYEKIKTSLYLYDEKIADIELTNNTNKTITIDNAIITYLSIYLKDMNNRNYAINGIKLDPSIKNNCTTYNGTYIEKNGVACLIENNVEDLNNYIILHGDYLNIEQDELDHLQIGIK